MCVTPLCPNCKSDSKTLDTRKTKDGCRRRRECVVCGFRFSTLEILCDVGKIIKKVVKEKMRVKAEKRKIAVKEAPRLPSMLDLCGAKPKTGKLE